VLLLSNRVDQKMIQKLFFATLFFPSTLAFIFPGNQVQPLYGTFAIAILFFGGVSRSPANVVGLILVLLILFYSVITLVFQSESVLFIALNALSYIFPVFAMLASRSISKRPNTRLFFFLVVSWFLLGFHQSFIPANLLSDALTETFSVFIGERFTMYRAVDGVGGRGSQFFTPEPASAASTLLLFAFFLEYFGAKKIFSMRKLFVLRLAIIAMVFMNKSATTMLVMTPYLFLLLLSMVLSRSSITERVLFLVVSCFCISAGLLLSGTDARFFEVIVWTAENLNRLTSSDIFLVLSEQAGARVSNFIFSYGSLLSNYGFGHGVAGWHIYENFLSVAERSGIWSAGYDANEVIKPWSYAALIAFDIGSPGLICLVLLISSVFSGLPMKRGSTLVFLLSSIFLLVCVPPTSSPVPWIIFGLIKSFDIVGFRGFRQKQSGTFEPSPQSATR
jgi:hypothetical protein